MLKNPTQPYPNHSYLGSRCVWVLYECHDDRERMLKIQLGIHDFDRAYCFRGLVVPRRACNAPYLNRDGDREEVEDDDETNNMNEISDKDIAI